MSYTVKYTYSQLYHTDNYDQVIVFTVTPTNIGLGTVTTSVATKATFASGVKLDNADWANNIEQRPGSRIQGHRIGDGG